MITTVLTLIEQILPLLGAGAQASGIIGTIITALIQFAPQIEAEIPILYTGVKNIIDSLSQHPAATADQLKTLKQLDVMVDEAWDKVDAKIDPDAPSAS